MLECLDTVVSLAGKFGWRCRISHGFKDSNTLFVLLDRGNEQVMVRIKPGRNLKVVTVESCRLRTLYADDEGELSEALASLEERLALPRESSDFELRVVNHCTKSDRESSSPNAISR